MRLNGTGVTERGNALLQPQSAFGASSSLSRFPAKVFLTDPRDVAQPRCREPLFMPHKRPCRRDQGTAQAGGNLTLGGQTGSTRFRGNSLFPRPCASRSAKGGNYITLEANSSRCVCAHRGGSPAAASTNRSG